MARLYFQVDDDIAAIIEEVAEEEMRSVSNLLALIVSQWLLERSEADLRAAERQVKKATVKR
jgi:hypothetical protein